MKHLIAFLAALAGFGVVYLLGAFVSWDLNAGSWSEFTRVMVALLGLGVSMIAAAAVEGLA